MSNSYLYIFYKEIATTKKKNTKKKEKIKNLS